MEPCATNSNLSRRGAVYSVVILVGAKNSARALDRVDLDHGLGRQRQDRAGLPDGRADRLHAAAEDPGRLKDRAQDLRRRAQGQAGGVTEDAPPRGGGTSAVVTQFESGVADALRSSLPICSFDDGSDSLPP